MKLHISKYHSFTNALDVSGNCKAIMQEKIKSYIENLGKDWQPVREQAEKYIDQDHHITTDGTIQIFRRPWVAPLNYGLTFYPPAPQEYFQVFQQQNNRVIPSSYQQILLQMNGCFVYDFALYGLPPSLYTKGLHDRSHLQPFDLGAANTYWINEYSVDRSLFYFGCRAYSFEKNIGYFLNDNNEILSVRQNGEQLVKWATFQAFLEEEIPAAEKFMIDEKELL